VAKRRPQRTQDRIRASEGSPRREWSPRSRWLALAGILTAGALAYANSLQGVFLFDDVGQISSDALADPASAWRCLSSPRGVAQCSLRFSYLIGQLNPTGYHAFNLAVHLAACAALFGVLRRALHLPALARLAPLTDPTAADAIAALTTLLWAVHPLGTQAVTYVIQRAESMMALFYLVAVYGALRVFDQSAASRRKWAWTLVSVTAGLLGMCTKQVMITAPVTILLLDGVLCAGSFAAALRARPYLYAGHLACAGWLFHVLGDGRQIIATGGGAGLTTAGITPLAYFLNQGGVILDYLRLALVPYPLCLDYYRRPASGLSAIGPTVLVYGTAAIAVLLLLSSRFNRSREARPRWLLVALFFLILAPTSSFMPIADLEVEHRMYLPLALVLLGLVLTGARAPARLRRPLAFVALVVAASLGTLTHLRNRDYASAERMWTRVVELRPSNPRAGYALGTIIARRGDHRSALEQFKRALALRPDDPEAIANLGMAYIQLGDLPNARATLESALARHVASDAIYLGLGSVHLAYGDFPGARREIEQALAINPNNASAHANLATLLANEGQLALAEEHFERARRLSPELFAAHNGLGLVYLATGRFAEAAQALRHAAELDPGNELVQKNLARAEAQLRAH
jgi:Flp pilus assembly protein TadD